MENKCSHWRQHKLPPKDPKQDPQGYFSQQPTRLESCPSREHGARQPEACASPGGPSEKSACARTNQRQAGSRVVGANLPPDTYHFLRNTLKDFCLQVLLPRNSINAVIVSPLGCLHSISLMSWEDKWRGNIGKVLLLPGTRELSLTPPSFSCPPESNPLPSSGICHLNVSFSSSPLLGCYRLPSTSGASSASFFWNAMMTPFTSSCPPPSLPSYLICHRLSICIYNCNQRESFKGKTDLGIRF